MFSMFTWLMFIPFLMFLTSHDHMTKKSHYHIMIFYMTLEFYSMDAPPPSFSTSSSITPPLYSPLISTRDGPICNRTWLGPLVWRRGRRRKYSGGLSSDQTRHCQGQTGPSIKLLSIAGCIILSGTLTGLGKVRPPIVVRRVVPTQSWLADAVTHKNNLSDICTNHYNIQSPEPGREWKIREVR